MMNLGSSVTLIRGSRAVATSKMKWFVIIVNGFQLELYHSILDVAAVLDPALLIIFNL